MSDKDKKTKPAEKLTPEERLFKVIATGGRDLSSRDKQGPSDEMDQDPFTQL